MNSQGSRCQEQLIRGVRALVSALKTWSLEKDVRSNVYRKYWNYVFHNFFFLTK